MLICDGKDYKKEIWLLHELSENAICIFFVNCNELL